MKFLVEMVDKIAPPSKRLILLQELHSLCGPNGEEFILGAHMVCFGPSKCLLSILYHKNDLNSMYVENIQDKIAAHLYQYTLVKQKMEF